MELLEQEFIKNITFYIATNLNKVFRKQLITSLQNNREKEHNWHKLFSYYIYS